MTTLALEAQSIVETNFPLAAEIARQLQARNPSGLTKCQLKLFLFIRRYIAEYGVAPSFDEMMAEMDLASKSGIHRLLSALEERGHIYRIPNKARSIQLAVRP